jgi:hypothetical protein
MVVAMIAGDDVVRTPFQLQSGGWWAKREDYARAIGIGHPSGTKVRAFLKMVARQPGLPIVVGSSATSLMQVYAAYAGMMSGREAHVFVPARKRESAETRRAIDYGAIVTPVRPGYLSVCRARARAFADGASVRWEPAISTADTAVQVEGIPASAWRVVVPCGSGAIAAGVVAGLAMIGRTDVAVVAVAVSVMTGDPGAIARMAAAVCGDAPQPSVEIVRHPWPYDRHAIATLDDGTELDGGYAAKAASQPAYLRPYDVLWISGARNGVEPRWA